MKILQTIVCLAVLGTTALATTALDPSIVGVGARSLAQGRALAAIASGPDSIFLNPASLGELVRPGATSMYSNLLGQVNYIQAGAVAPGGSGGYGVGALSASIGGLQNAVRDPITGRITFESGTVDYYNNIFYFTIGQQIFENLSSGVSFKLYSQGFSSGATGTGYDADVGLTYQLMRNLKVGFVQRNCLPAAAGAKIKWSTGAEESLATSSRVGATYDGGAFALSADYKFFPTLENEPGQAHAGLEAWISPYLALRLGADQDSDEINMTAGLGLLAAGYAFDYAYHQYGDISQNTTHTFSLSFGVFREMPEPEVKKQYITVTAPEDKSIYYTADVSVRGSVLPAVKRLEINNFPLTVKAGQFRSLQPLALGKNAMALSAYGDGLKLLEEKKLRILRLRSFADVPADYWVRVPISIMAMEGIITGYPDGTFRPGGYINRAEMCALLMKILGVQAGRQATIFKDVKKGNWASGFIAQAVLRGIVKGYPDDTFRPSAHITRAEGVAIIARFAGLESARMEAAPFPDLPGRHWAAGEVMAAKEAGLLKYMGATFEPKRKLTRAEVVEILSKTDLLAPRIEEVLNFEEGY